MGEPLHTLAGTSDERAREKGCAPVVGRHWGANWKMKLLRRPRKSGPGPLAPILTHVPWCLTSGWALLCLFLSL